MVGWKRLALKGVAAVALVLLTATVNGQTFEVGGRGSDAKQFRQLLTEGQWQVRLIEPTANECQHFWISTEATVYSAQQLKFGCFSGAAAFEVGGGRVSEPEAGPVWVEPSFWSFTPKSTQWRLRFTKVGVGLRPNPHPA